MIKSGSNSFFVQKLHYTAAQSCKYYPILEISAMQCCVNYRQLSAGSPFS